MKGPQHIFFRAYSPLNAGCLAGILALLILLSQVPAWAQAPVIDSFSPQKAFYGEIITIQGSGFAESQNLRVSFGSAVAEIVEANATRIKVKVPAAANYAPIVVTNLVPAGLSAYSSKPFLLSFGGRNNGEIPLEEPLYYPATELYDVCACDLDGDGLNDLAGSNQTTLSVSTYLNASAVGNIRFPIKKDISAGHRTLQVVCGDLDGDGKPDLVYTGNATDGTKVIFLRNISSPGNISFAAPQSLSVGSKALAKAAIQDLDGDGKPEIILSNMSDDQVVVFKNTSNPGNISFNETFLSFTVPVASMQGLRIKDVNNDGLADITVSNLYGNKVFFLINSSTPDQIRFQEVLPFNGSGLSNHELEDLDGDGKPELITLDYFNNKAKVYLNNSSDNVIAFAAAQAFDIGAGPVGLQLGDLNGDQKVDLLIGHNLQEGNAYLLVNSSSEGSLSFHTQVISGAGKFTNVQISDFDGDAIPDIVLADRENKLFNVYRNSSCLYPAINPSGTVELCEGSSVTLSTVQTPLAELEVPLVTYQWLKDGVAVDSDTGHSLRVSTPGNYSLRMTAPDGCSATSNTVNVNTFNENLGTPVFELPENLCAGEPLTLKVTQATADAEYTWTNNSTGFSESSSSNSLTIEAADPALHAGNYTLTISKGPCQATFESPEISIHENPTAPISVDGNLAICADESRVLLTEEGFSAYQWLKDGQPVSGANSVSFTAREAGTYSVVLKNSHGCETESEAISLEVNKNLVAAFEAPEHACLNEPLQFNDESELDPDKAVSYLWDFGDGTQSTNPSPAHTYTQAGNAPYTVTLTIQYDNSPCSSTYSQAINIHSTSNIFIEAPGGMEFCQGDSLKVQVKGSPAQVSWSNGDTGLFTYAKENGVLKAQIITESGCEISKSITLTRLAPPDPDISADKTTLGKGETARLQASGGVAYSWEPAESLDDPTIANPIASPEKSTTYKVTVISAQGCIAEAEITIEVDASFKVQAPKLLIPATDQTWKVGNIENYPEVSLTILNKFGKPIFQAAPYENTWDGTENGRQLNEGIYYYVFKDSEGKVVKTGSISLLH